MLSLPQITGEIAEQYPENLVFCDTKTLLLIAEDKDNWFSNTCRSNCLAELLIRLYLSKGEKSLRKRVADILSPSEVSAFLFAVMPLQIFKPENANRLELWNGSGEFSLSCRSALRKRLRTFFRADGVIPTVDGENKGWMIPFELEKGDSNNAVFDLEGRVIEEWNDAVSDLDIVPYSVRVHCYTKPMMRNDSSFLGRSLMLPVWTAFLKKKGYLPAYNPFQFVLTGAFDKDGILSEVNIKGKATELAEHYANAQLIVPESCDISGLSEKAASFIRPLPDETMDCLIPEIRKKAELSQQLTLEYAIKRLPSLCDDVRYYHHGDWNEIIKVLEATAKFDEDDNPTEYLLNLSLQCEAHCHNGNTEEALVINEKAYAFAKSLGNDYVLFALRLQINKLVLLTDEEDFEGIAFVAPDLQRKIEECGDLDLQMRYHGTMGQFYAYGTLAGVQNCSKEKALSHFEKAKTCAFKLNRTEDKRQDLNYLHLWYALFEPGTKRELEALSRAERMAEPKGEENLNSDNIIRNIQYLRRQQLLARYRAWMIDGTIIEESLPPDIHWLLEGNHTWIRALAYKYLGALAAARGEKKEKVADYFERATQPLDQKGPIIDLIRMTIHCEAFRSTDNVKYQQSALKLVKSLRKTYPNQRAIDQWEVFLNGGSFPGLSYWY